MASALRFCLCFFFAYALLTCSARTSIFLSGDDEMVAVGSDMEGRSLMTSINDYSDPSANKGHDPRNKVGGSGRKIP